MERFRESSFLAGLLAKKAMVLASQGATGSNLNGAVKEVDRQIREAAQDIMLGKGVTKSGQED